MARKISHTFNSAAGRISIYTKGASSVHINRSSTWTSITVTSARPAPADDFNADPLWTPTAKDRKTTAEEMKRDIQNAQSSEEIARKHAAQSRESVAADTPKWTAPQEPPYVPEMPNFPPARFLKY